MGSITTVAQQTQVQKGEHKSPKLKPSEGESTLIVTIFSILLTNSSSQGIADKAIVKKDNMIAKNFIICKYIKILLAIVLHL